MKKLTINKIDRSSKSNF